MRLRKTALAIFGLAALALAGCASAPATGTIPVSDMRDISAEIPVASGPAPAEPSEVAELAALIRSLGPGVDPEEAARVARISLDYPLRLRREYGVTDPPLIHNTKVNLGLRPRGLCYQWADDMEARLRQENLQTLVLHRAIANADNIRIEHSTVIASAPGDDMFAGVVLDPWRFGGDLYWSKTLDDPKYRWVPRAEVFEMKRRQAAAEARRKGVGNI